MNRPIDRTRPDARAVSVKGACSAALRRAAASVLDRVPTLSEPLRPWRLDRLLICSFAAVAAAIMPIAAAHDPPAAPRQSVSSAPPKLDHTGRKRVGTASFYARKFAGRKMADGERMNPRGNNAASKTLPLGTKARVTNLESGQSADIHVQDRGPYVKGRIVDLSPSTAQQIGIDKEKGVAEVEVAPIAVPQPDGSVKPGAAAKGVTPNRGAAGQPVQ